MKLIISQNKNIHFHIKPHPNDPVDLWQNMQLASNVDIVDGHQTINSLFELNPSVHLCMDGCTTILDAYLANIPVFTFGHFPPFDNSFLNSLGVYRLKSFDYQSFPYNSDHLKYKQHSQPTIDIYFPIRN